MGFLFLAGGLWAVNSKWFVTDSPSLHFLIVNKKKLSIGDFFLIMPLYTFSCLNQPPFLSSFSFPLVTCYYWDDVFSRNDCHLTWSMKEQMNEQPFRQPPQKIIRTNTWRTVSFAANTFFSIFGNQTNSGFIHFHWTFNSLTAEYGEIGRYLDNWWFQPWMRWLHHMFFKIIFQCSIFLVKLINRMSEFGRMKILV